MSSLRFCLGLILTTSLLLPSHSFASAEPSPSATPTRSQERQTRREELKERIETKKTELKDQLTAKLDSVTDNIAERHANRLENRFTYYANRLGNINTRLRTRLQQMTTAGQDTTALLSSLAQLDQLLLQAKSQTQTTVSAFRAIAAVTGGWEAKQTEVAAAKALAEQTRSTFKAIHNGQQQLLAQLKAL